MTRLRQRLGLLLVLCVALSCTTAVVAAHQPVATDDSGAVDGSVASLAQEGIVIEDANFDANEGPHVHVVGEVTVDDGYHFFPDANTVQIGQHGTFTGTADGPEIAVSDIDSGEFTTITAETLPTPVTADVWNAQEISISSGLSSIEYRDVGVDDGQRDFTYSAEAETTLGVYDLPSGTSVTAVDANSGETLATADVGSDGLGLFTLPAGEHDVVVQTAADVDPVTVALEDVEAAPGASATVTLSTENVDDLAGYEATVSYDPSVVSLEDVSGVALDDPVANVDNENGTVTMTQSAPEAVDGNPNPTLAELTFTVVGDAGDETALELDPDALNVNNEAENLPTTTSDGSVTVTADDGADDDGGSDDGESDDGGSDGLPGFTPITAATALLSLSTALALRRRTAE